MNRAEFMRRLTELLGDVPPMEREEAIQYYNDYFDDAGEENEGGVIASLGTPEELAGSIKAGLSDGGSDGEFTESGFKGYTKAPKDEIMRTEDAGTAEQTGNNSTWTDSAYNNSTRYEGPEYRSGQAGNDNTSYRQGGAQNTGYSQNGSSTQNTAYGQADTQYSYSPYGQSGSGKEGMSGGMIALIVILAVLTSPVWIGLLGGFFGVAAGVIATLFALFLAFLIMGVVFVAVSIALLVTGISLLFSVPSGGLCLLGCAFVLFAVGLLCIWLMIVMAGTAIPACIRGIVSLCRKIFHRGGARA